MSQEAPDLFTRLAPVLNVRDLAVERVFYERLGLPVIYEGPGVPEFISFGTETAHFGIQKAAAAIDAAMERCRSAGIGFELEHNNPGPGWTYRRLLIRTPSGYRPALEGPNQ